MLRFEIRRMLRHRTIWALARNGRTIAYYATRDAAQTVAVVRAVETWRGGDSAEVVIRDCAGRAEVAARLFGRFDADPSGDGRITPTADGPIIPALPAPAAPLSAAGYAPLVTTGGAKR